jgi:hypothetical protein
LLQWPGLAVGVPGEPRTSGAAAAEGALCRVPAREQLNIGGQALFFLEARIVGRDALASVKSLHLGRFGHHIRVQERSEFPDPSLLTLFALCQDAYFSTGSQRDSGVL